MNRDAQKRTRIIPVRVNEDEYRDALACSSALGISLSRLMRSRAEALPPSPAKSDLRTAAELARIGNNLNQLVHQVHAGFRPEIHPLLLELRGLVIDLVCQLRGGAK